MSSHRFIHGSQSPADCEVFGQDESRSPLFWALGMIAGLIALAVGINAFWALLDGGAS